MGSTILLIGFGVFVAGVTFFAWLLLVRLALTGRWLGRPVPGTDPHPTPDHKDDLTA